MAPKFKFHYRIFRKSFVLLSLLLSTVSPLTMSVEAVDVGPPLAAVVQEDGKIVIVRAVKLFGDALDFSLTRFNPDGSLDQSFGPGGNISGPTGAVGVEQPTDVAIQTDGKIVVVGSKFGPFDHGLDFGIIRINSDGSLDSSFNDLLGGNRVAFDQGGANTDSATGIAIQTDGKIVVIGSVEVGDGGSEFGVLRLDSEGSLDPSFGFEGLSRTAFDRGNTIAGSPTDVAIQSDGKIVVVGSVELENGDRDFGILRLTPDGNPDTSFGVDGRTLVAFNQGGKGIDTPTDVVLQTDGKIVVVGSVEFGAGDQDFGVVRLNSDGSLDTSFGISGGITIAFDFGGNNADTPSDVVLQTDGKILVVGSIDFAGADQDYAAVRLNANGRLDTSFGINGTISVAFDEGGSETDLATNAFVTNDGAIMIVGSVDQDDVVQNSGIVFLNSSGNLVNQVTGMLSLDIGVALHILGLESPFNTIVPQHSQNEDTPTFVLASFSKQTDPVDFSDSFSNQYSGTWFDPSHNGEGFLIEILDNDLAVIYWFTYDKNGNQVWITGSGSVTGQGISVTNAQITSGGIFGPDFDPMQVNRSPWGSLTFSFDGCNTATIDYSGPAEFGTGRLNLQRLTSISGLVCGEAPVSENQTIGLERITGLWFDPSHDGEGYLIEILDNNRAVMFWFTYNKNGDQTWILGVGSVSGHTITISNAEIFSGGLFGPNFDPSSVIRQPWGSIIFTFSDCNTALVNYTGPPEFGMGTLNLTRLTSLVNYRCTSLP